jgi:predicted amidophosphoribosyltransferase
MVKEETNKRLHQIRKGKIYKGIEIMGIMVCRERCSSILHVSRKADGVKICDACNYYTKTIAIFCPCCGKKYRTRKHGRQANKKRKEDKKRI